MPLEVAVVQPSSKPIARSSHSRSRFQPRQLRRFSAGCKWMFIHQLLVYREATISEGTAICPKSSEQTIPYRWTWSTEDVIVYHDCQKCRFWLHFAMRTNKPCPHEAPCCPHVTKSTCLGQSLSVAFHFVNREVSKWKFIFKQVRVLISFSNYCMRTQDVLEGGS